MKKLFVFATAGALVLGMTTLLNAQNRGAIEIPQSSIERAGDVGVRAHTNIMIFHPVGQLSVDSSVPPPTAETPASLACDYHLVTPLVTGCPINGTTVLPTGGSKAIAIVDAFDDPNAAADLATYSAQFGLPVANFSVVFASGTRPPQDSTGGWELEEALDIEMAHAMAPNAQIFLVEANSNSFADLFLAEQVAGAMVSAVGGGTVTNSWSGSEFSSEISDDHFFVAPNVVFLASAGDAGNVNATGYPSVSPNVISAGGTSLNRTNGLLKTETYWTGGGGGISLFEKIPSYQSVISGIVGTKRGTPDISLDANPSTGVAEYDSLPYMGSVLNWLQIGGTSVSSPALAGIINAAGGFSASTNAALTKYYREYANATQYPKAWRDIKTGATSCKVGWDICDGIGSPITYKGK